MIIYFLIFEIVKKKLVKISNIKKYYFQHDLYYLKKVYFLKIKFYIFNIFIYVII